MATDKDIDLMRRMVLAVMNTHETLRLGESLRLVEDIRIPKVFEVAQEMRKRVEKRIGPFGLDEPDGTGVDRLAIDDTTKLFIHPKGDSDERS